MTVYYCFFFVATVSIEFTQYLHYGFYLSIYNAELPFLCRARSCVHA